MATSSEKGSSRHLCDPDGKSKIILVKSTRCDIQVYNKEVDEAIARVEAGEYYTHEEVERMAKEW